jgi:hypothetical protein
MARDFRPLRTQTSAISKAAQEVVYDTISDLRAHLEWSGERASSDTFKLLALDGPQGTAADPTELPFGAMFAPLAAAMLTALAGVVIGVFRRGPEKR